MSAEFTKAAASYFGIDIERMNNAYLSGVDGTITLHIDIVLQDGDYAGIGRRLEAMSEPAPELQPTWVNAEGEPAFVQLPTLQQVMRTPLEYISRPECAGLLDEACAKSQAIAAMVEKARAEPPALPDPAPVSSGLDPYIYLPHVSLTDYQRMAPYGHDTSTGLYAVRVDDLTIQQLHEHEYAFVQSVPGNQDITLRTFREAGKK